MSTAILIEDCTEVALDNIQIIGYEQGVIARRSRGVVATNVRVSEINEVTTSTTKKRSLAVLRSGVSAISLWASLKTLFGG